MGLCKWVRVVPTRLDMMVFMCCSVFFRHYINVIEQEVMMIGGLTYK